MSSSRSVRDARRLEDVQTEAPNKMLSGAVAAAAVLADVELQMEAQLRLTYHQWKDSRLARDPRCR